jgi:hypothetical protein
MALSRMLQEAVAADTMLDIAFEGMFEDEGFPVEERKAEDPIAIARRIVQRHQHEKIQGVDVDAWTASLIIGVYDALSAKNKASFKKMPIRQMADVATRLAKKVKAV